MSFDWSEYLNIARELAGQATASPSAEAKKRCAILAGLTTQRFAALTIICGIRTVTRISPNPGMFMATLGSNSRVARTRYAERSVRIWHDW